MKSFRLECALMLLFAWAWVAPAPRAEAFCGFYVAQGDAKIYNHASKVVLARSGERTVITMVSDYRGDPKQFAVVIPVPVVPEKSQVHVGDSTWVEHLDHYSVPRLVEYTDPNPCPASMTPVDIRGDQKIAIRKKDSSTKQIVTADLRIEASYKVDEYEIVILSATEGRSLERWLTANGYRIPEGAGRVLQSYIKQGMYFFLAKIDVQEQQRLGYKTLRPIQVAYESPKFMLPIRLGMVNAEGPQEMFVFTLTPRGRVETTNYRTVRVPTDQDVPEFVKADFPGFYRQLFVNGERKEGEDAVFLEYAWVVVPNRPTCDPCTAPYLAPTELRSLGAYWIAREPAVSPGDLVLTRLHLRYDGRHFPEDLQLQETADRTNWQARYVIHHPYRGMDECPELDTYHQEIRERRRKEAENFCELTGADLNATRSRMAVGDDWFEPDEALHWWERLWR
jgi:hypothetical protein